MVTYTAHELADGPGDATARAESVVFVKEGIAWWALPFPILWLIYHRLWLALCGFVLVMLALEGALALAGVTKVLPLLCSAFLSLVFALIANDLRRWTLSRRGYVMAGVASGRDLEDCELRFFDGWPAEAGTRPDTPREEPGQAGKAGRTSPAPGMGAGRGDDVIGLFPEPGR